MPKFDVSYFEKLAARYEVEAKNETEACEIVKKWIDEGSVKGAEEIADAWYEVSEIRDDQD